MSTPPEQPHRAVTSHLVSYEIQRAHELVAQSAALQQKIRRGMVEARQIIVPSVTPIFDNLNVVKNPEGYGLAHQEHLFKAMVEKVKDGKKVVAGIIGPSGAGKTSVIMDLLFKFVNNQDLEQQPRIAVISSESVYNAAKAMGVMDKDVMHGAYTDEDYNRGSAMIERAAQLALLDHDIVLIDTPSTTGVEFEFADEGVVQFGKNRGTSALKHLSEGSGHAYEFYAAAIVPGGLKAQRSYHTRRALGLAATQDQFERMQQRLHRRTDDPNSPRHGASAEGTNRINQEIDTVLFELCLRRVIEPHARGSFALMSDPAQLSLRFGLRTKILGESFYPVMMEHYLGIARDHAFIGENEELNFTRDTTLTIFTGLMARYNFVDNMTWDSKQQLLAS